MTAPPDPDSGSPRDAPPRRRPRRPGLVVDASVTMAWGLADEVTPLTESLLDRVRTEGTVVPAHWLLEVANIMGNAERHGRATADDRARFFTLLQALRATQRIRIAPLDDRFVFRQVWELMQRYGLTSYDAAYLELAIRRGLPLATFDAALQEAAR
ncbi:MAG: type II toxin-antitoxin system VapC family toxin, partial [Chloroflexota bacterium]